MENKNIDRTFLKLEGVNLNNWISIQDLSEILKWYEKFIKESLSSFDIKYNNIDLKISDIKKGSIIVDLIFHYEILDLFSSTNNFLDILQIIDLDLYDYVQENLVNNIWWHQEITNENILQTIQKYWKDNIEEFWKEYPVLTNIIVWGAIAGLPVLSWLLYKIYNLIAKKKIKNSSSIDNLSDNDEIDLGNTKIKWKYIKKLKHRVISSWKAKDLLEPIINDEIDIIKLWDENNIINSSNLELFLWEWNQILPWLINWQKYHFTGSFTAMQSNKWETMKFKSKFVNINWTEFETKDKSGRYFLFVVNIPYRETTENYSQFYWDSKILHLEAEVLRENEYKKPKLKLLNVEVINKQLF